MAAKPTINTILQLVQEIFGKNALSKTIGTRTNVIRLPDASVKRLIKGDLDIARANDAQLETFRRQAEELIPEIPRMNDQELLTFKGNLQRYYDRMYPPKAEVFDFQTKTQVPKQGVEQLETNLGVPSDIDINSPLGRMFQKTQQMKTELKSAMGETKPIGQFGPEADRMLKSKRESIFGKDYDRQMNESFIKTVYKNNDPDTAEGVLKYFNDVEDRRQFQKMLREGGGQEQTSYSLMTPITNEILNRFIRADKIKLSPGMRENLLKGDRSGLRGKPVETFMEYFGVDNMEVLDNFLASKGSDYFVKNNYKQVVDDFMKSYPDLITPEFTRRTGGQLKVMNQPERDLLTFEEKVNFLTGNLGEKGPLSKSLKEYYNKNIDPTDPDITSYIMQYAKEGPERVREVIKNLPDGYLDEAPEVVRRLLKIDAEPEMFATGGRVGMEEGGVVPRLKAGKGMVEAMMKFILENKDRINELYSVTADQITPEFLQKIFKQRPQTIKKMYDDMLKLIGRGEKSKYRFTGKETIDDLRNLEEKGVISRADHNVYGERYLDYLNAKVKYTFGYTKGQMNEILQQPARLNHLRAKVDPAWGEANFGPDYMSILEKERAIEVSAGVPEAVVRNEQISKPNIDVPEPFAGKYDEEFMAHDNLFGRTSGDPKVDAQEIAEQVAEMKGLDFDSLSYKEQMDLYDKAYNYLTVQGRVKGAMKEKKGRTLQAGGGLAYLMGL